MSKPSSLQVRVAGSDEVAMIARLRSRWTGVEADPAFEERLAAWLGAEGDRRTTWLARVDAQPVGMASLFEYRRMPRPGRPDTCWDYLSNMFVQEEHRNQGIGSALLSAIIKTAKQRGYVRLVLSPSPEAVSFYQRAGFLIPDDAPAGDRLLVRPL